MRILKVRFQNLNSLAGKWEIDFTNSRYVSDGIFAIVGPTGAGKSTLMDAICLALYGRTPRLKTINASGNEIMTTNTGVCYSEVEFSTQRGIYRSTWSQRRSREKADGNLQSQQMEVAVLTEGEERILTEKIGESLLKIEEVTGMDYDRFVQSMMLAQGAFAQFLKATPKERSPILEEITGKQIYTELSIKAHERSSQEQRNLRNLTDQMASIALLTDDEKLELNDMLAVHRAQLSSGEKALQQLATVKNWLLLVIQLRQQLEQQEQLKGAAMQQIMHFQPQLLRLERAELAAQLDAEYTIYELTTQQKNLLTNQVAGLESSLPELQSANSRHAGLLDEAKRRLNGMKQALADSQGLFQQVRLLDARLASDYALIEDDKKKEQELGRSIGLLQQEIDWLQQQVSAVQLQQASALQYLEGHVGDKQIQHSIAPIELYYRQLMKVSDGMHRQEQLHQQLLHRRQELEQAAPGFRKQLEAAQGRLGDLQRQLDQRVEALRQCSGGREEAWIRRELQLLHEKRLLVATIRKLEEERAHLIDGQPCPLCGSVHHPFAGGNLPTDDEEQLQIRDFDAMLAAISEHNTAIQRLQQEQLKAGAELSLAGKAIDLHAMDGADLQKRWDELSDARSVLQAEFVELKSKIVELTSPFGFPECELEGVEQVLVELKSRVELWDKAVDRSSESDEKLYKLRSELGSKQSVLEIMQHQHSELQEVLQLKFSKFSGLKSDRIELFGEKRVEEEEMRMQQEVQQAELGCEKAQEAALEADNRYRQEVQRLSDLRVQLGEVDKHLDAASADLVQKLHRSQFVDIADFVMARMERAEMQQLQQERRQLEVELERLETLLAETRKQLENEKARNLTEESVDAMNERERLLKQEMEAVGEAVVQVRLRIEHDERNHRQLGDLLQHIEKQQVVANRWAKLNQLIGSADGSVFNKYAQGLTFEIVLNYANIQLQKLTDRYVMRRDSREALAIQVVDTYQNNRIRSTDNLSGGESFLFSLALALGLAQISSRNIKIETLFLDEGFGTLDEDTLEIALDALNSLHQEGRLIGIISHVAGLKESINTQIVVEKGMMGRSTLKGPGVSQPTVHN
jgi:exonuclease SbcC